ncbi:MAG: biotin transporter BioY [Zhaonellaceae bacterium]|jgi:biotin transport system substrate-specific component|nr:biotin transporter BioY [Clostridia bacterium]
MSFDIRQMTIVSIFTSLTIGVAVFTRFSASIIPFSMLPLMVMLAGNILGSKMGFLSMLLYLFVGMIGIPAFASPPYGGLAYVTQPSFGFLIGFIFAAYVIGRISERGDSKLRTYFIANIMGMLVINFFGLVYFWLLYNYILGEPISFAQVFKIGAMPFLIPDLIKSIIASFLGLNIRKRLQLFVSL